MGGWRDFQKGGKRTKEAKTWKQEVASSSTEKPKFGASEDDDYKKAWK